jgi:putative NADPH-quinone reductase
MGKRVLLIQGHPDVGSAHLCRALEDAYAAGAREEGHEMRRIDVGTLDFPLLKSQDEWEHGALPPALQQAQADILWSEHLVFFFPLWLGDMPAILKGFLEQVARSRKPNLLLASMHGGIRSGCALAVVVEMGGNGPASS